MAGGRGIPRRAGLEEDGRAATGEEAIAGGWPWALAEPWSAAPRPFALEDAPRLEERAAGPRDRSGPVLLEARATVDPASGSEPILLRFDEPVRAGPGAIRLVGEDGAIRIAARDAGQVAIDGAVVRILPDRPLAPEARYTLELGAKAFRDLAGNPVAPVRAELLPPAEGGPPELAGPATARWTIMVYMAADNDLERFALEDLAEMERVALPSSVNLVALVDRSPWYVAGPNDFTDTRVGPVRPDGDPRLVGKELVSIGERDTGDPATLTEFLDWARATFPAERYGLVVWNHGGGLEGVAWDQSSRGDRLTLPEVRTAIERSAIDVLDLLGFDACLMAMAEVASEMRDLARVMVASQDLEPGPGWAYDRWLPALAADPAIAPQRLGEAIVASYAAAYPNQKDITLSALELAAMPRLEAALDRFVDAVELFAEPDELAAIARAAGDSRAFPRDERYPYRDLDGFLRAVERRVDDPAIDAAARGARDALAEVVLATGGTVARANGLSVHLPEPEGWAWPGYEPGGLAFLDRVGWDDLAARLAAIA
ncbi:MAG: clostripain-related cysteine peptidase [Geminicoccaceae bacterium]|nr:clostripain-related cysteine peptidase [Geminicoccaceae bacterium]MCX8102666.1 clostripain-related cysteine peptidase [Geminicoccaceae bacterium]MDW8371847.1 clostripain-related cysteine peptidase [Geminicoccaceae bacterium]